MNNKNLTLLLGFICSISISIPITANDEPSTETVRLLASQCAQCHGTTGNTLGDFDSIANEDFVELLNELLDMKKDSDNKVMHKQINGYTDQQIRFIADYYARLPAIDIEESNMDEPDKEDEQDHEDEKEEEENEEDEEDDD